MKKIFLPVMAFLIIGVFEAKAQNFCGTIPDEAMMERLKRNIANSDLDLHKSGGLIWVPLTFHLVAKTDGTGRIGIEPVLDNFCRLNSDFLPYGMQFYMPGEFNNINNTGIYESTASSFVIGLNKVQGTLNVFVGHTTGTGGCFGVLGFYSPTADYIFMTKCTVSGQNFALSHEAGHFFSLAHTFLGWEETNYSPGTNAPFMVNYAGQNWDVEKAARTGGGANCDDSADNFCDTPPDYNFGLGWNGPTCNYTANALDPIGEQVIPMEQNFLGYFFGCPSYQFTPGQEGAIFADHAGRTFIGGTPHGPIAETPDLISPINGITVAFSSVTLNWEAETNATRYILEINRTAGFNSNFIVEKVFVNTNSYTSTILEDNQTYYWRVRAYNNNSTCLPYTSGATFKTGTPTSVQEIAGVSGFSLYPNPVGQGIPAALDLYSDHSFEARINIYDLSGKMIRSELTTMQHGFNNHSVTSASLNSGIYIISIQAEEGVLYKKLVVSD